MRKGSKSFVILGGGTAGWMAAAALSRFLDREAVDIRLVESEEIGTVGVGEATIPPLVKYLRLLGVKEQDFMAATQGTFKLGIQFENWREKNHRYIHSFGTTGTDHWTAGFQHFWLRDRDRGSAEEFGAYCLELVAAQQSRFSHLPKQGLNYAFHLDATLFAGFLRKFSENLGAIRMEGKIVEVDTDPETGFVRSLKLDSGRVVEGDLFIDCTGTRSLLLGEHFGIPFQSRQAFLFNDTALAAQVPYATEDQPIQSCTHSTAQTSGWIWDIGLPTRRGTGHVFSSAHISEDEATAQLLEYIKAVAGDQAAAAASPRKICYQPGHRQEFWHRNCVAIGMSSGFIEPLEASALVMIELAAGMIADQLPATRETMDIVARRYNRKFLRHWTQIIEFLKLHYVLSLRDDSDYWRACRDIASCPAELQDKLVLWQQQAPWHDDAPRVDELFPSASYQFVLYGMGFRPSLRASRGATLRRDSERAARAVQANIEKARQMRKALPANRELLNILTPMRGVA